MKTKIPTQQTSLSKNSQATFLEHLIELRGRLFWVVGTILAASALAFPFQQEIISIVTAPLGGQHLYYLTPAGGFSFIIKLSMYVGVLAAIPVAMYHLYRYLEPLLQTQRGKVLRYTALSVGLAVAGICFAYFVSLPAALHFLTGVALGSIQAMLTVDAYLSFVMTYVLVAAALFQLPLILLIINMITPLKPRKLMSSMRFVIVGAFILAAIISPTPDVINQALLAVPMIAMYAIGVAMVWWQNGRKPLPAVVTAEVIEPVTPVALPQPVAVVAPVVAPTPVVVAARPQPVRRVVSMDGFMRTTTVPQRVQARPVRAERVQHAIRRQVRSIDGVIGMGRMPLSPAA